MATVNPYLEIIKQIEQKSQLDEQKANTTAQAGQQNAYIGYMTAKRDLGDTLASQGIVGGGSESAALGANVGYQRQQNAVMGNRANEVASIRQNALANKTSTQSQSAQWVNDQQQLAETRFANTVTGYDTIAKVDNAVDAAKDAGETWKVPYLMAQRAALVEKAADDAEEAAARAEANRASQARAASSGGSSGGGGGDDRTPEEIRAYNNDFTTGSSSQGTPYSSGGISGTQGGMTSTYYPTRPFGSVTTSSDPRANPYDPRTYTRPTTTRRHGYTR